MTSLAGKTALVTGSTSGIGLAIAEHLAAAGAKVMLNGFGDAAAIETLRADMAARHGVAVAYNGADMSQPEQIGALVVATERELGAVDILVNNAGIQHVSPVQDFPPAKWDAILAINLSSAFHTTRLCVAAMKGQRWGRIINVASAHGLIASPFKSAYVAAKHGVVGFTKSVALELAEHGVTCNAICPGYVLTPLVEKQIPDTAKARNLTEEQVVRDVMLAAQPTKQFITVDQVAQTALFLCSDAASQITGTALSIDGGWIAQ